MTHRVLRRKKNQSKLAEITSFETNFFFYDKNYDFVNQDLLWNYWHEEMTSLENFLNPTITCSKSLIYLVLLPTTIWYSNLVCIRFYFLKVFDTETFVFWKQNKKDRRKQRKTLLSIQIGKIISFNMYHHFFLILQISAK